MSVGFINVPPHPAPALVSYTVIGTGPGGTPTTLTVQATCPADAIAEARKRSALNGMSATLTASPSTDGPDPTNDLSGCVEVPEGVSIRDFIENQRRSKS